jgi:anti-sigma regulatory factor (Ser/Thr protein kinase)
MPSLTIPGNLNSLAPISDMIVEQAQLAGLDKHAAYQLQLAVDELATNSIVHGYQAHGLAGNVTVSAELNDQSLRIVIEDTAVPYDPRQRDIERVEETFDDPLEEREIGGLGVYFVMQAVNEFDYERVDGRNRNTLVVHRAAATVTGEARP